MDLPCYHVQSTICFFVPRSLPLPEFPPCAPSCWIPTAEQSPILSHVLCDRPQTMGALHCDFLLPTAQSFAEVSLEVPLPHRNALPSKPFLHLDICFGIQTDLSTFISAPEILNGRENQGQTKVTVQASKGYTRTNRGANPTFSTSVP